MGRPIPGSHFISRGPGSTLFLTSSGAVLALKDPLVKDNDVFNNARLFCDAAVPATFSAAKATQAGFALYVTMIYVGMLRRAPDQGGLTSG